MSQKKIVLTGGGTAGHVTPHLALVPRLREQGFEIHYIGTRRGIEHELIVKEDIPFYPIAAGKLRRYFDLNNFSDILKIFAGFIQAFFILVRVRPAVIFSKGGFVSCPVVWASWLLRIPVIIHESDITPGLANRLSIPFASKVCYSFQETAAELGKKGVYTGLPVREELRRGDKARGRERCGFTDDKPVVMIIGGSQGSKAINTAIRASLDKLLEQFNLCHICGRGGLLKSNRIGYCQFEYVHGELPDLFAAADLAVCRSGATTLFELLALCKPCLLIPLPESASRGDQILNARSFEKRGWAMVLPQEELTPDVLVEKIVSVYEKRSVISQVMASSLTGSALDKVLAVILDAGKK